MLTVMFDDIGRDHPDLGLWMPLVAITMILMVLVIGRVVDSIGSKKPMLVGCIIASAALLLVACIFQPWQFWLFQHLLFQIGDLAVAGIAMHVLLLNWFRRRRGLAFGLVAAGAGVGKLIIKPLGMPMAEALGWRGSYALFGAVTLLVTVPLVHYFIRERPSEVGQLPDGDDPGGEGVELPPGHSPSEAYSTRTFWLLAAGMFLSTSVSMIITMYWTNHLWNLSHSMQNVITLDAWSGGMAIAGVLFLGWLADRWGARRALVAGISMTAVSIVLLTTSSSMWILILLAVFYGIFTISFFVIFPLVVAECHGLSRFGTIYASLAVIGGAGATLAGATFWPIRGYLIDSGMESAEVLRIIALPLIAIALLGGYCIYKTEPLLHAVPSEESE